MLGRAVERGIVSVGCEDPRAHTRDVHRTVDDRPYGGGPGMVLKPEPMSAAIDAATARQPAGSPRIYMSAQGVPFTQALAQEFSKLPGLTLVAGRYEGLDERVIESRIDREVSVGDYVLSGVNSRRSWSSMRWRDCCPGCSGTSAPRSRSLSTKGLLDWPHYTRPVEFEGRTVPEVLQGGHHADIQRWRLKQAVARTWLRRPDLIARGGLPADAAKLLDEFLAEREGDETWLTSFKNSKRRA